jgi:hypothetical protein
VCLEHHPDKKLVGVDDPADKERIEDYFKQIQEAYEVRQGCGGSGGEAQCTRQGAWQEA